MGMYTELVVGVGLKPNTPPVVIDALKFMAGLTDAQPSELPDHRLFATDRWRFMLRCGSYYFAVPDSVTEMKFDEISKAWWLSVRSNMKNYGGEIRAFMEWIAPFVEDEGFVGHSRYEEDDDPTLFYIESGRLRVKTI
jgi:hypothetical protein